MWDLNLGQWAQIFNGIARQWHKCYKEVSLIDNINYVETFKIQESCAKAFFLLFFVTTKFLLLIIQQMFVKSLE